jgi:hypothetical protein
MTHTPGPWRVGAVSTLDPFHHYVNASSGLPIAIVLQHDEREANARLIALAPDMLALCERSLNWLASYPGGCAEPLYLEMRALLDCVKG